MIPVYYDLHIHTALSPCADDDMTPNDIVGMAVLNGLDIIAVTDHNSLANARSVIKAAEAKALQDDAEKAPQATSATMQAAATDEQAAATAAPTSAQARPGQNLIVLPGIEVMTAEEVHVLCLFSDIEAASGFETELTPYFSPLANRVDIFGEQLLYDENDRITGKMERMLIASTTVSFDELYVITQKHGGAFIPAHVDRDSFSVISNLGFLPPHLKINAVEVSPGGVKAGYDRENTGLFPNSRMIFSSDAHQLWAINEKKHFLMLPERSSKAIIDYLR